MGEVPSGKEPSKAAISLFICAFSSHP